MHVATVLVPQGAEYQAVCRGLQRVAKSRQPNIIAIPAGPGAVSQFLQDNTSLTQTSEVSLLLGLAGSLDTGYGVGDRVITTTCIQGYSTANQAAQQDVSPAPEVAISLITNPITNSITDPISNPITHSVATPQALLNWLTTRLPDAQSGRTLTTDRMLHLAAEKQQAGQAWSAQVVEMEGWPLLSHYQQQGWAIAMVRVISDDCSADLPDLSSAIGADGTINAWSTAIAMLRYPPGAWRLIQGS
ncbi:MAG: hypothetical protein AAGF24_12970, partial [Cyanobacteria bacterium P01_H01_bin.121]